MVTLYLSATETLAELAWRYGETGLPHCYAGGYRLFADGSSICLNGKVHTPRSHREAVERTHGRAGKSA